MLNTLTNALDVVDNTTLNKIKGMIKNEKLIAYEENSDLYTKLKKRAYIFNSLDEEQHLLNLFKQITQQIIKNTKTNLFTICPTMGCNLRCTYCYENHFYHENFNTMTQKQLKTILGYIKKSYESRTKDSKILPINLFGGEPLLKSNYLLIRQILEFSNKINIPVSIATNGTTLDENYFNLLKKYKTNLSIQITFDGDKNFHDDNRIYYNGTGTFDDICMSIEKLLNLGIHIVSRINVDIKNIEKIGDLKVLFEKNNWSHNPLFSVYAAPIRHYDSQKNNNKDLSDSQMLKKFFEKGWYGQPDSFVSKLDSSVFDIALNVFKGSKSTARSWNIPYCHAISGCHFCFSPNGAITTCIRCAGEKNIQLELWKKTM